LNFLWLLSFFQEKESDKACIKTNLCLKEIPEKSCCVFFFATSHSGCLSLFQEKESDKTNPGTTHFPIRHFLLQPKKLHCGGR